MDFIIQLQLYFSLQNECMSLKHISYLSLVIRNYITSPLVTSTNWTTCNSDIITGISIIWPTEIVLLEAAGFYICQLLTILNQFMKLC